MATGLTELTNDWSCGVLTTHVVNGALYNADYQLNINQPEYFTGDKSISVTSESSTLRNYLVLLALLLSQNNQLTIQTYPTTGNDTYNIGKSADILYCARYIDSFLTNVINTSTASLPQDVSEKVGKYDIRFTVNNLGGKLICRITSNSIQYIRQFSISDTTIILLDPETGLTSPIATLSKNDRWELLNSFDVLEENLESTVGYPVQGYVIKHIEPNGESFIKFGQYDKPSKLIGEKVVITYKGLLDFKQQFPYEQSMLRYGTYIRKEELNFPVTQETINYIEATLKKFTEPMVTINLETYRPNKPKKGWKINVNVPGIAIGQFTITGVSETYIHPNGQLNNVPFRLWKVTLANYVDNLQTLLAGLKRKNDLNKAKLADNIIYKSVMNFQTLLNFVDDPAIIDNGLIAPQNLSFSNLTNDSFNINFDMVDGQNYKITVYLDGNYNNIAQGLNFQDVVSGQLITSPDITDGTKFWVHIVAIKNTIQSMYTELIIEKQVLQERILGIRYNAPFFSTGEVFSCKPDGSDFQLHTSSGTVKQGATYLNNGDIIFNENNTLYRITKASNYATKTEVKYLNAGVLTSLPSGSRAPHASYESENIISYQYGFANGFQILNVDTMQLLYTISGSYDLPNFSLDNTKLSIIHQSSGSYPRIFTKDGVGWENGLSATDLPTLSGGVYIGRNILDQNNQNLIYEKYAFDANSSNQLVKFNIANSTETISVNTGNNGIPKNKPDGSKFGFASLRSGSSYYQIYLADWSGDYTTNNQQPLFSSDTGFNDFIYDWRYIT